MIQLDAIDVSARRAAGAAAGSDITPVYAGGQVANGGRVGLLGNQSVFDTPFSTTSFTAALIQDQQARSLADVLANDPSVREDGNRYLDQETRTIRGFISISDSTTFLGLPGMVSERRPIVDGIERVELIEGPSTLLNGAVSSYAVGGVINVVPKRADSTPTRDLTALFNANGVFGDQIDLGQRFGPDGAWGVRAGLSGSTGATNIDHQRDATAGATAALDYAGQALRVSLDLSRSAEFIRGYTATYLVAPGLNVPKAPNATRSTDTTNDKNRGIDEFAVVHAEYDVSDAITIFGSGGASRQSSFYAGGYLPFILDEAGDASTSIIPYANTIAVVAGQVGARAVLQTGPISHRITLSADRYDSTTYSNSSFAGAQDTNIYHPLERPFAPIPGFNYDPPKSSGSVRTSIALADTLSALDGRVLLTLGGREQNIDDSNYLPDGSTSTEYNRSKFSPSAALVVKPLESLSVYGNYIEQLNSGPSAPIGAKNVGAVFPPIVSTQKEFGAKYDFGRVALTAAIFEIEQPTGVLDAATQIYGVTGVQRNRGVEVKTFGEIAPGVRLLGGIAVIDAKQIGGATAGKTAVAVPTAALNLYGEWDTPFVPSLTLTGRAIVTSREFIDAGNTQSIPGWRRFDIGARYRIERAGVLPPITVRASIENVGASDYWQGSTFGTISVGAPRTYLLSATASL